MKRLVMLCLIAVCAAGSVQAAFISWNDSQDLYPGVTTESFVYDTDGSVVLAFAGTADDGAGNLLGSTTVNGVVFDNADGAELLGGISGGGVTISSDIQMRQTGTAYGDGSFSGNGNIYDLIAGAVFDQSTITMTDLTPGQAYLMQIMVHDGRTNKDWHNQGFQVGFSDGVNSFANASTIGTQGTAHLNNRLIGDHSQGNATGDYIIGTFTADATGTQSFEIRGTRNSWVSIAGSTAQINAMQLRTVPEPATMILLGLGSLVALKRRRA